MINGNMQMVYDFGQDSFIRFIEKNQFALAEPVLPGGEALKLRPYSLPRCGPRFALPHHNLEHSSFAPAVEVINRVYAQSARICRAHYSCTPKLRYLHTKPPNKFPYITVRRASTH